MNKTGIWSALLTMKWKQTYTSWFHHDSRIIMNAPHRSDEYLLIFTMYISTLSSVTWKGVWCLRNISPVWSFERMRHLCHNLPSAILLYSFESVCCLVRISKTSLCYQESTGEKINSHTEIANHCPRSRLSSVEWYPIVV